MIKAIEIYSLIVVGIITIVGLVDTDGLWVSITFSPTLVYLFYNIFLK